MKNFKVDSSLSPEIYALIPSVKLSEIWPKAASQLNLYAATYNLAVYKQTAT